MEKGQRMIQGFERETAPLSEYERETLLPVMVECLSRKVGKDMAVTNDYMCVKMEEHGYKMGAARVRKIINHIRVNDLIDCLMATNTGYYIAEDRQEMRDYISSLIGREEAIRAVREAMERQLEGMDKETSSGLS